MTGDNTTYHSPSASEYEPESPPPLPPLKSSSYHNKTPKTPKFRQVISGRVEKSGGGASSSGGSAATTPTTTLKCPVKGCGQTFTGRNPRQSLWHHLKYYATRGLPDKQEFEKAHGEAHTLMKEEAGMVPFILFLFFPSFFFFLHFFFTFFFFIFSFHFRLFTSFPALDSCQF